MEDQEPKLPAVRSIAWLGVSSGSTGDVGSGDFDSLRICIIDPPVAFDPPSVREGVRRVVNFHRVVINNV